MTSVERRSSPTHDLRGTRKHRPFEGRGLTTIGRRTRTATGRGLLAWRDERYQEEPDASCIGFQNLVDSEGPDALFFLPDGSADSPVSATSF